ncbi:uncharacterized protein LOC118423531 [Branchiostoma floridae]|uniref:Uncharacterized protein LOC118423531 n=1 Tax=Branchiostoma floridae TaxID=7739 RepID=A0A9J7LSG7_BRAFL|nr:uncharacterized protein LOC118423531 [Branchiostoma floridae]
MAKRCLICAVVFGSVLLMLTVRLASTCAPSAWVLPDRCPDESERILLPSGKVYWAERQAATYESAQKTCRVKGGLIAVPTDSFQNSALVWLKNCVDRFRPIWIGLQRQGVDQWGPRWVHAFGAVPFPSNIRIKWPHTDRPFSAWAPGEPDIVEDRRCARIVSGSKNDSSRDKWADAKCSSRHRYICEKFTDPECSQYKVLMEPWRSVRVKNLHPPHRCESQGWFGNDQWYRFMGEAGTAMPTETPPSSHRCGSDTPVWMNGTHPTYEDGVVERHVCARHLGNICRWKWTIHVKACPGGFLIYKLPPMKIENCHSTYCGLGNNVTVVDTVSIISNEEEDISKEFDKERNVSADELSRVTTTQGCDSYTELSEAWRSVHFLKYYPPHDQIICDGMDTKVDGGWYRFTGEAGDRMVTERPLSINRCNTHAPVWMKGAHPTLNEGVVRRTVCAFYSRRKCNWRWKIHVRACPGGYFVYKLPPAPVCHTAYCSNGQN